MSHPREAGAPDPALDPYRAPAAKPVDTRPLAPRAWRHWRPLNWFLLLLSLSLFAVPLAFVLFCLCLWALG